MAAYFRGGPPPASTEEMAEYYQKLDMFGVLFAIPEMVRVKNNSRPCPTMVSPGRSYRTVSFLGGMPLGNGKALLMTRSCG